MSSLPATELVPLHRDTHGVLRVGGTRVTLDTVVAAFETGASAEEIADDYPLRLDDVYAVITYYLRHRDELRTYLEDRRRYAVAVRREHQERFDHRGLRDKLLARLRDKPA